MIVSPSQTLVLQNLVQPSAHYDEVAFRRAIRPLNFAELDRVDEFIHLSAC